MSVRKRNWKTATGEERSAWVLAYKDRGGKRRSETFAKKKKADRRAADVAHDIKAGVHVPRSASITVADAGENWIASRGRKARARHNRRVSPAPTQAHQPVHWPREAR